MPCYQGRNAIIRYATQVSIQDTLDALGFVGVEVSITTCNRRGYAEEYVAVYIFSCLC